jgi:hypothetical protein
MNSDKFTPIPRAFNATKTYTKDLDNIFEISPNDFLKRSQNLSFGASSIGGPTYAFPQTFSQKKDYPNN